MTNNAVKDYSEASSLSRIVASLFGGVCRVSQFCSFHKGDYQTKQDVAELNRKNAKEKI